MNILCNNPPVPSDSSSGWGATIKTLSDLENENIERKLYFLARSNGEYLSLLHAAQQPQVNYFLPDAPPASTWLQCSLRSRFETSLSLVKIPSYDENGRGEIRQADAEEIRKCDPHQR